MIDLKKFTNLFNSLALHHSAHTVFSDFLTMVVCALAGGTLDAEYMEVTKRYKAKDVQLFAELFAEMVLIMDDSGQGFVDVLGEFFTLNITRGQNGQFFTPQNITDLMAQLTADSEKKEKNKTVMDPACGSGRTLLSFAKFNSKENLFFGADVDSTCAKMCVINLCLNGMRGQVAHMNSLSLEMFSVYDIFYDAKRFFVPTIRIIDNEASIFYTHKEKMKEIVFEDRKDKTSIGLGLTQLSFNLFEEQEAL